MGILDLKGVSKGYGETPVLKRLELSVEEGEFLAVLGFSGTGKTTLINLLAGLELPDQGEVLFRGGRVIGPGPERGLVFQSYALMPWLTVAGNIGLAVDAVSKGTKAERASLVSKYIAMVGLGHAADRRPAELSGGMRQRVAVARRLFVLVMGVDSRRFVVLLGAVAVEATEEVVEAESLRLMFFRCGDLFREEREG